MMRTLSKITLVALIGVSLIGIFLFWMADPLNLSAPTDKELAATFFSHESEFKRLGQMVLEDAAKESYFSSTILSGGLGESRLREYKDILAELGSGVVLTTDDNSVRYVFSYGGLLAIGPGWAKGIEYIPNYSSRHGDLSGDLDHARLLPDGVYLRGIAPNWFIFYQSDDG